MKVSLSSLNIGAISPNLLGFFTAIARNSVRSAIAAAAPGAVTNNSGGATTGTQAVNTINVRTKPQGANLAARSDFNTNITAADSAIANLRNTLADYFTALGDLADLGAHPGAAGVARTVAPVGKTVTAVDGSAGNALMRVEANSAISRQRNNLATLIKAYNTLATAMGVATIPNNTGGNANSNLSFNTVVTATTAVDPATVATADLAGKAGVDASLAALANNISYIADRIQNVLRGTALTAREPVILLP